LAQRVPITVHLDSFEGPLDLLLYLIQTHELDISKVSISKITDQYLSYVLLMQELNFDTASEFLVMAATLLQWKSRALLPQEDKQNGTGGEGEALTQEDLVRQLLEHQRFLEAGENLSQLPLLGADVFCRSNKKPPIERIWREMSLTDLTLAYQDMLVRARRRTQVLKKETVSIADKIMEFKDKLILRKPVEFSKLLSPLPSHAEIVATFLATLELSRLKKSKVYQEGTYQPIFIELVESLKGFDPSLASGFDLENQMAKTAEQLEQERQHSIEQASAEREALALTELLIQPSEENATLHH
jgi:segregation and condensation protein A